MPAKLLFVIGGYKGGTTHLMGMLNCHDDIYLEGELFCSPKFMNRFKKLHPEAAAVCSMKNRTRFYSDYAKYISEEHKEYNYRYVGEKIATLDFNDVIEVKDHKTIFICRDIRTWILKPALQNIQKCKNKKWATQFAVEFTSMLIRSFGLKNCCRITMEDMFDDNAAVLRKIGAFINMPLEQDLNKYNERMGKYDRANDPKKKHQWWKKQPSSRVFPPKPDVISDVNENHPLWKVVLPIFDKYYQNVGGTFSKEERKKDLRALARIKLVKNQKKRLFKSHTVRKIHK